MTRKLGLRALLMSVLLCVFSLLLGLFRNSLFAVLWIFWFPGMLVVAYPLGMQGFDLKLYPRSALLAVLVDVFFWWLVIYLFLRLWRTWRNRRHG